jgi:hypothetical protein
VAAPYLERVGGGLGRGGCHGLVGVQGLELRRKPGVDGGQEGRQLLRAHRAGLAVASLTWAPIPGQPFPATKVKRLAEEGQRAAHGWTGLRRLWAQVCQRVESRWALPPQPHHLAVALGRVRTLPTRTALISGARKGKCAPVSGRLRGLPRLVGHGMGKAKSLQAPEHRQSHQEIDRGLLHL